MVQPDLPAARWAPRSPLRAVSPADATEPSPEPLAGPRPAHPAPRRAAPPLVPLIAAGDDLTPELDRVLTGVARAAQAGDSAARDAVYLALEAKIARFVARYAFPDWSAPAPRRDDRPWHAEDLAQEAFVLLFDLIADWPGDGPFGRYFFAAFPWRLHDAARRLAGPWRWEYGGGWAVLRLHLLADDSTAAEEALVLLDAIAADLPPPDDDVLRWRIRDGESFVAIARRLGLTPRTVNRRWVALLAELRRSLDAQGPDITKRAVAVAHDRR